MTRDNYRARGLSMETDRARRHERLIQIGSDYQNGLAVEFIAESYQCSRQTVLRAARLLGLDKRPKHFPRDVAEHVLAAYRAGVPLKEIRRTFGVSEAYASKLAKEHGISRYGPRPHRS